MLPGLCAYVSQIESPLPSSSHAPSIWYDDVPTPQKKPFGIAGAIRGEPLPSPWREAGRRLRALRPSPRELSLRQPERTAVEWKRTLDTSLANDKLACGRRPETMKLPTPPLIGRSS